MIRNLAQILNDASAPVPPLPGPPLWERLLLEEPVYLAGALGLAAIVAFVILNQRARLRTGAVAAVVLLLAAAGVMVLGTTVRTEREAMAESTASLVDAVARVDTAALDQLLASDVMLVSDFHIPELPIASPGLGKNAILAAVGVTMRRYPVKEHRILATQAQSTGPGIGRTQVRVRVVVEGIPHTSWWKVDWRRGTDGRWRAIAIRPLDIPWAGPGRR